MNGISLQSMSFDDACDAFSSSSWPRMILFQKPIENIKTTRANDILTQYLILQRSMMSEQTAEKREDKRERARDGHGSNHGSNRHMRHGRVSLSIATSSAA